MRRSERARIAIYMVPLGISIVHIGNTLGAPACKTVKADRSTCETVNGSARIGNAILAPPAMRLEP